MEGRARAGRERERKREREGEKGRRKGGRKGEGKKDHLQCHVFLVLDGVRLQGAGSYM
jgi:hypothetical protein